MGDIDRSAMTGVPGIDRQEIELFLMYEARLLDERRFEEWMALFTEDGYYWVPARPGQDNPHDETSLFYDDRELMKVRVTRLGHPGMHSQNPPSRTCHLVTNVLVEEANAEAGELVASSTFIMVEYRLDDQRVFSGRYRHKLLRHDGGFRIAWKKADLINCDSAFTSLAVPI